MKKNKIDLGISLTCYKRDDYLNQVLSSLKEAIKYTGINTLILYPNVDLGNDKVLKLIEDIDWIEKKIEVNKPALGCNKNTKAAISRAIYNHEAVLHIEDDTVLAHDAIDFYLYALDKYKDNTDIISVSGYNKTEEINIDAYHETFIKKFFCCWGCAFWRSKIEIILNNWTPNLNFMNPQSWDSYLQDNLFKNRYSQVRPVISRIQNIGAKNGTYVHDPVWHYYNHRSPFTSDDLKGQINLTWEEYAKNNQ